MSRIPDQVIEEIRQATDIVNLVSRSVRLKKSGQNYFGLCPFHKEETPSFSVSPSKQIFHCFGCGQGGNAFSFVMLYDKVGFMDAIKILAREAGISVPEESRGISDNVNAQLYQINGLAAQFFNQQLSNPSADPARDVLRQRGFSPETIQTFAIGYAPPSWDEFLKLAQAKGFSPEQVVSAGLAIPRENSPGYYDRFRNRLMFPIHNLSGKVVGFGGRRLPVNGREEENTPKYINSPETSIYHKSDILYGLNFTRNEIQNKDTIIIVEGYADFLSLFQAGIQNVSATSGTALTPEQSKIILRFTKNVLLLYDGDSAGSKATIRGADLLLESGLNVSVVEIPEGEDPDTYVRKIGGDEFNQFLQGSLSFVDFKFQQYKKTGRLNNPGGRSEAIHSILATITKIPDAIYRNHILKGVAEKFETSEGLLRREMEKLRPYKKEGDLHQSDSTSMFNNSIGNADANEKEVIKMLLSGDLPVVHLIFTHLTEEDFLNEKLRHIFQIIQNQMQVRGEIRPVELLDHVEEGEQRNFVSRITMDLNKQITIQEDRVTKDCIMNLRKRQIQGEISRLQSSFKSNPESSQESAILIRNYKQALVILEKRDWAEYEKLFEFPAE